jgi:hypothetical protein
VRYAHALKFLEVAELAATEQEDNPESVNVAASLAVLAGIAASDAACCAALGRRSRSPDHHDAERFLREIAPGGSDAATRLGRLLDLKDNAQYGFLHVGGQDLRSVLRQSRALVKFAERTVGA